jgi:hypothetical protein
MLTNKYHQNLNKRQTKNVVQSYNNTIIIIIIITINKTTKTTILTSHNSQNS